MKKIIFTVITSLLIFTSCSDDFVENPPTGTLDTEYVFSTEENVEKAVLGLYDLMQYNYAKDWHSAYFVKLLPGDDANAAGGNAGDQAQLQDIDDYANVSISNTSITSNWDLFYRVIALANVIVDNVEGSSLSNKAKVLAEAKFMRAWCYFELTTMWGDVPLRLHNPDVVSPEAFALAKSPRTEIYTQVESDLTEAITGLPDKSAVSENFRVCKGTAQALMGKVLVFQEKYSQAIPYLADVIANPAHDLEPDPANVWTIGSEFGIESLFELGYISTEGYDWGSFKWGGRVESNAHIILMGTRDFFDVAPVGLLNGWGFNLPTKKLIDAFDAMGDTERKAVTLMTEAELIAGGGAVKEPAENIWDYEGAIRIKYTTRASDTSPEGTVRELNYTTNWRLLRYAEVLLLAAEAYNKDGQDGQALIELNKVHERAGLAPLSGLTGDALFNAIVNEKFVELAHEGQRFWDLVRWGRAATELAGTGYTSKNDLFPIPVTEIELNDALTNADQNPGY